MLLSKCVKLLKIPQQINIRGLLQIENRLNRKFSDEPVITTNNETVETVNADKDNSTDIPDFTTIIDSESDEHSKKPDIVDVNINDMMEEDRDFGNLLGINDQSNIITSTDLAGAPIAPIDINPWVDEREAAEGTVDMENLIKPEMEYPPIPKNRENSFKFKGIRIKLPMRMLNPGTYRYRIDDDDKSMADDMQICKY